MKQQNIKHIVFIILLFASTFGISELHANARLNTKEDEAILRKADDAYQNQSYSIASIYYENYLDDAGNSKLAELAKLADCYWKMREYNDALRVYLLLFPNGSEKASRQQQLRIGELYARFGQYQQASQWLLGVKGYQPKADTYNDKSKLEEMKKDSLNWTLGFLNVNTNHREFSPVLIDNTLFFCSNKPLNSRKKANSWDGDSYTRLWKVPVSSLHNMTDEEIKTNQTKPIKPSKKNKSKSVAGVYECADTKPVANDNIDNIDTKYVSDKNKTVASLVQGLNGFKYNSGTISMDKNSHVYFSANYPNAKNGVNRIHLMEGIYTPSGVVKKHALPFGDPNSYSVMHPAVNQAGTILVFSSDKPDGRGGFDLYYVERSDINKPWGPLNTFDENINTLGNEVFPNITPDGFLYFSSDLLPGLGGLDIFRIPLKDAMNRIGKVEHLSYPINSSSDDFGWTQDSTGTKGYFTSDRKNENDNLYSFFYKIQSVSEVNTDSTIIENSSSNNNSNISKIEKRIKQSLIEGYVLDKITMKPILGATVFLLNKRNGKVMVAKTDENGKYNFVLPAGDEFLIKAISSGYSNDCNAFDATDILQNDQEVNKTQDLLLGKYYIGKKWKLKNIHYDFNKFNIRPDARPILDSLIEILKTYPITAELGSHTDSRGSNEYNQRLSQHRADAAVAYLVEHGIDKNRITAKGYGETQLLNKCEDGVPCSEAAHQENRRTEVKVTGYTTPESDMDIVNPDKFKDGQEINKTDLPTNFFDSCNKENIHQIVEPDSSSPSEISNQSQVFPINQPSLEDSPMVEQRNEQQSQEKLDKNEKYIANETITPGGRLALFARMYYGNRDFWCYIYRENKNIIPDPDHIPVGTVIRIPKLDPSLIDTKNPECIRKARELDIQYLKQ
ncbi:MAG: OmpA family protein [Paludibacter sp.]|nr:OmpA family protein [Paludibacter sp.]